MLEWAAPAWLLAALAAVPLVWWLHARRDARAPLTVSALYLWREARATATPRAGPGRRDPRWWLRALVAVLLCLAAARPLLPATSAPRIELWLDDRPSMLAAEAGGPRALLAADAVRDALAQAGAGQVVAHRLRTPAAAVLLDPRAPDRARLAALLTPAGDVVHADRPLPAPVMLGARARHWLVTDGSDPALAHWLATAPVARVIQAGATSENAAVLRLAVRPARTAEDTDLALLEVANLGLHPARRSVSVEAAGEALFTAPVDLAPAGQPGDRAVLQTSLPVSRRGAVTARLSPPDALSADDHLFVDTHELDAIAVAVSGVCSAAVRAGLAAHPGLRPGVPAALLVACGDTPPDAGVPALWFRAGAGSRAVTGWPVWRPQAGPLADVVLAPAWLQEVQTQPPQGVPLLAAGDRVLIALHETPSTRIEVLLDTHESVLTRQREFAALLAALIARAVGRDLLDPVASAARSAASARIAPATLPQPRAPLQASAPQGRDLTMIAIAAAGALLLAETLLSAGVLPGWPRRRRNAA